MNSPTPFLAICNAVTFDGELTSDEIWILASWLNDHPEDRVTWPGTVLFPLLHTAFEDGQLTTEEMSSLNYALAQIEAQAPEVEAIDESKLPPIINQTEEWLIKPAIMPPIYYRAKIPSFSSEDEYDVDLEVHSCTCPDWFGKRASSRPGELARCCKHIIKAFSKVNRKYKLEPWLAGIFEDCSTRGKGTDFSEKWYLLNVFQNPVAASKGNRDWSNVYVCTSGAYSRYGYNFNEARWSYGMAPYGSNRIKPLLHRLTF